MGTVTAQIMVGSSHRYHGGITPSHALYLSENDRPAWVLIQHDLMGQEDSRRAATWIPTVDHMLEDGLTMIAAEVVGAPGLTTKFRSKLDNDRFLTLPEAFSEEELQGLREIGRAQFGGLRIIITVLPESTIMSQLHVLDTYNLDAVVCLPRTDSER
jgi:hypothetical protein